MSVRKLTLASAGALAISASAVMAAPLSFSFDLESTAYGGDPVVSGSQTANSFSIADGDMVATFTGRYLTDREFDGDDKLTGSGLNDAYQLNRWKLGAGTYNVSSNDQHTVDGVGYYDFIEVSFAYLGEVVDVTLDSLGFGYIATGYRGTNSMFDVVLDSNDSGDINYGDMRGYGDGTAAASVDLSSANLIDSVFGIMAGDYSSWKLKILNVEYMPPSEVPLPAAGWLLIGGLGGLAGLRRMKRKA